MAEAAVDCARAGAADRADARGASVERAIRDYFDGLLAENVVVTEDEIASLYRHRAAA